MSLTDNSDNEDDFNDISESNFRKIQRKAEKTGFIDGITDGKESTFQLCFDKGYEDGLRTGLELEKYKAFYEHVGDQIENTNLILEKSKYIDMQLPPTQSKDHFQYTKREPEKSEDIAGISQQQHIYVNELLLKLEDELPITSNLFCSNTLNTT